MLWDPPPHPPPAPSGAELLKGALPGRGGGGDLATSPLHPPTTSVRKKGEMDHIKDAGNPTQSSGTQTFWGASDPSFMATCGPARVRGGGATVSTRGGACRAARVRERLVEGR